MPKYRIMIVEDEVVVSADLRNKMEQLGYDVCEIVRYGEKVLDAVLQNDPDLILMDIKLKGEMDGITAAQALMDHLKISVIFLTAFSDSATLNRAKTVEPLGYVKKPVSLEDLRINIEMGLYKTRMEQKLRQSRQDLDMLFNTIEDMLFILDTETRIIGHNRIARDRLGYSGDELIGRHVLAVHPQDRHEEAQEIMAAIPADETGTCMIPLLTRNGDLIPVETKVKKGRWNGREVIFAISRDISERLEIERKKRLIEKVECLSRMAGAIAHRFNNMLEVIMGNLELAMGDLPHEGEVSDNLNEAIQASREAAKISGLMLTYLGQAIGKRNPMDLSAVCRDFLPILGTELKNGWTLKIHIPLSETVIEADTNQIQQVLRHLIANAAESIEDCGGDIHVSLRTISPQDIPPGHRFPVDYHLLDTPCACLKIKDTGHGIAEKDIDRIFDPFFSTRFTGRGLGLPVVLGIVRAHGGMVMVDSKPGSGSIFQIFFPLSAQTLPILEPDLKIQPSEPDRNKKILLVDDEQMVRKMVSRLISRLNCDVLEARNGYEAIEMLLKHKEDISLVLLDLTMPGMNGWETLAGLREIRPELPVIMTSGYDETTVMNGKSAEQPQAFLRKPYSSDALKDALDRILQFT